jgi:MinD-like ATPase involved in chromosome partitioning or flagellar assembly
MENSIVSVWGSPSCGKTVTTLKLARELEARKKNVVVVLADQFCPGLETIIPGADVDNRTLGRLLFMPHIRETDIIQHAIPYPGHSYVAVLGYKHGDSIFTYGKPVGERINEFFMALRQVADYAIVDCSSVLLEDAFSTVALQRSDKVLRLYNADLKSYSYYRGQIPILSAAKFRLESHVGILSDIRQGQEEGAFRAAYGAIAHSLPHVKEIELQSYSGNLLEPLSGKEAKKYNTEMAKIAEEVFPLA